ncbi:MAG: glycosyltransferase family 39 protein, partial [Acidobacteria bacterium]|nr:glycosyltransferase family 39 protein [Acidobacteriota bacterium]
MTAPSVPSRPGGFERLEPLVSAVIALVATFLILFRMAGDSPVSDEPVHLASGVETLARGTWTWNPEHPPLAKAGAALGLAGLGLRPPEGPFDPARRRANLLAFLNDNTAPQEAIVFRGRLFSVALFLLLLWGVRREARARFGVPAGCAALALAAFEPTLQAHAGLVHTDLAVVCFLVLSLGPLRCVLEGDAAPRQVLVLGLVWGLMFLSKYSAPLLAFASLGLILATGANRAPFHRLAPRVLAAAGIALAVSLLGFSLAGRNQSREDRVALAHELCAVKGRSEAAERLVLRAGSVLPAAGNLLNGVASVVLQNRVGGAVNFLRGQVSREGFPGYFPFALAVKTSLGLLLALLAGASAPAGRRPAIAVLSGLLVIFAASASSSYNIGVRHVLFALPLFAVVAGAALAAGGPRIHRFALSAGLLIQAVECATIAPHPLSFFNALAGGPAAGRTLLVDSNLDWGQDLARLAAL